MNNTGVLGSRTSEVLALNMMLDESSPRAPQPPAGRVALKAHQLALLHRCQMLEQGDVPEDMLGYGHRRSSHALTLDGHSEVRMRTRMGILADRAGSGKSFVVLSLVLGDLAVEDQHPAVDPLVVSMAGGQITLYAAPPERPVLRLTLIVVPHTMVTQWREYVTRFAPSLSLAVVNRRQHLANVRDMHQLRALDLLIVTTTFYPDIVDRLATVGCRVRRAVYDEADNLPLTSPHSVDALFTWYVSASYGNMLYPRGTMLPTYHTLPAVRTSPALMECLQDPTLRMVQGMRASGALRALFLGLATRRNVTRALVVRNSDDFVAASIDLPEMIVHRVRCPNPALLRVVHGVVDAPVIQCLNAGDIMGALQCVAPSNRTTDEDSLVLLLLDRMAVRVRNLEVRISAVETLEAEPGASGISGELAGLRKERDDVQRRMAIVRERITSADTCCICCDNICNKTAVPCCDSTFCFKCITKWVVTRKETCPLCKARLVPNDLLVVQDAAVTPVRQVVGPSYSSAAAAQEQEEQQEQEEAEDGRPERIAARLARSGSGSSSLTKLQVLQRIITARRRDEAAKLLIFSSNENTFVEVSRILTSCGMRFAQLKGNGGCVNNILSDYRGSALDALLINTTHYGNGLNLENTTDVILFHRFGTEIEHQVLGRAMRMGRTVPLHVWYLLYECEDMPAPSEAA